MAGPFDRFDVYEYDVLVIGAAGAGLRAAIEVAHQGSRVGVVCKSLLGKAHTVMAEGGCAAAMGNVDPQDGWTTHFMDTMKGGKFLNNWRMAQLHAQECPDRVRELERWGAVFDRTPDGKISQRAFGGHTYRRLCHVGDRTGLELIRSLQDKAVHTDGLTVHMECTITKLFTDAEGRICGAFGYWRESGKFVVFKTHAIVLATGGIGKAFRVTSGSWEYTGDGQILAYDAGAELLDMEFIQFHPTGMVWPPGVQGILVTEAVRGEGGLLTNSEGERFMKNVDPERMELSTRDIVAKAIYREVKAGRGSPNGGVFLDISHRGADYIKMKLPSMYHQFKELADVDITKGPMEVGPTCHYFMGGVKVEAESQMTNVPGLFAAGEVASGLHGANRLGGNSLGDLLVFGRRAGLGALDYLQNTPARSELTEQMINDAEADMLGPMQRSEGECPYAIHKDLNKTMESGVGIVREADGLKTAIEELKTLKARAANVKVEGSRVFNPGWHLARDLHNLITVSEGVARCALQREESRGGHTRLDHEGYDDYWSTVNSIVKKAKDGTMEVGTQPLPQMPDELKQLFEAEKK
ncbi:MAG: FAD-binding protein [Cyanobacteria bacterium HKST-UBA05]|nr:FAD-binding protein [Cyanobacteria bacterium HKST-UBA05]